MLKTFWMLLLIGVLSACISLQSPSKLRVGVSSEPDVIAAMGQPVYIWKNDDGSQTYEYSSQPYGVTCYMISIDTNGKVQKIDQTLSDDGMGRIKVGMSQEQVQRILGTPRSVEDFKLSGEEVWDWTIDNSSDFGKRFNVHFKQGVVIRTSTSVVYPDDYCNALLCR